MSDLSTGNIFQNIPDSLPAELIDVIVDETNVRIERIVSTGQSTPAGEWYDQDQHEWVVVLSGEAQLIFANGDQLHLRQGDHCLIKAHQKHRVERTSSTKPTLWLAVFFD
ncbi:cupin domain-containing protein [Roseiconus lacunae]|uniref:cupin domain-containing protein n=1 Tax=Roseiconus lacunae TaxID=2605694 RepID=UPI003091F9F5|nr:cupin domain-containing protein [Stieleria sp. HD01]